MSTTTSSNTTSKKTRNLKKKCLSESEKKKYVGINLISILEQNIRSINFIDLLEHDLKTATNIGLIHATADSMCHYFASRDQFQLLPLYRDRVHAFGVFEELTATGSEVEPRVSLAIQCIYAIIALTYWPKDLCPHEVFYGEGDVARLCADLYPWSWPCRHIHEHINFRNWMLVVTTCCTIGKGKAMNMAMYLSKGVTKSLGSFKSLGVGGQIRVVLYHKLSGADVPLQAKLTSFSGSLPSDCQKTESSPVSRGKRKASSSLLTAQCDVGKVFITESRCEVKADDVCAMEMRPIPSYQNELYADPGPVHPFSPSFFPANDTILQDFLGVDWDSFSPRPVTTSSPNSLDDDFNYLEHFPTQDMFPPEE